MPEPTIKTVEDLVKTEPPKVEPPTIPPEQEQDYKKLYEDLQKKSEEREKFYEQAIKENQRLFSLCESYAKGSSPQKEESFVNKLIRK